MKFSIIVPIYNEEKTILGFINNLSTLKGNYEVIFSDGGSSDLTTTYINNKYTVLNSKKGRANQMNYGAKYATGDILLFIHCDSLLEEDVLIKIEEAINKGHSVGCLKLKFKTSNIWMKCCENLSNFRVKSRQIAFGDQGIFMKREVFKEIGGIPNLPIMEDYQLSINLKKKYKIHQVNSRIITSPRRYEQNGIFKTMFHMQKLQRMFRKGEDIEVINKMYRDIR